MARPSIPALVDELGELSLRLAEARKDERRADQIKSLLREHVTPQTPEETVQIRGKQFVATVGALPPKRTVGSIVKAFALAGQKQFLAICSLSVKAVEENFSPAEQAQLLVEGYASTRPVTVAPK